MNILITDSGVGGLSVCAYAERFVRTYGFRERVRLTFANAAPTNDYGYNAMPSTAVKVETFDRFLRNVTERYTPDFIYVACNTLSVLLPATPYVQQAVLPVKGIETGVQLLVQRLEADPRTIAMIFGTQTTIDAGTYQRLLGERGVELSRIIGQACLRLADTISEDREGARTRSEIFRWVAAAIERMQRTDGPVVACLACTHYGYREDVFAEVLLAAGIHAEVINPNARAVEDLFGADLGEAGAARSCEVDVEFVTRYAIPDATVEALTWFLSDVSPATVGAMRNFAYVPDLF
jgi:glutamate racemase